MTIFAKIVYYFLIFKLKPKILITNSLLSHRCFSSMMLTMNQNSSKEWTLFPQIRVIVLHSFHFSWTRMETSKQVERRAYEANTKDGTHIQTFIFQQRTKTFMKLYFNRIQHYDIENVSILFQASIGKKTSYIWIRFG